MIKSLIQIENGNIVDFMKQYGFIYVDSDDRVAPDEKEDAVSSYPEESGEHRDGRVVYAPFDYTAKFIIEAPNKDLFNVNSKISTFNNAIRQTIPGSDVTRMREISFYNLLNRVKIVGYPALISTPIDVYRSNRIGELDYAVVELKIRVSDPTKCDFDLKTETLSLKSLTSLTSD